VRKDLQLTQQEFSERLGMKRNSIAQIESGRNTSNQTLCAICREFNVSETWLRTGEGEPFIEKSKEDILEATVRQLLSGESSEFKTRLIKILATLGPREWSILEDYALKLVQDKPILNLALEQEADEFAAMARAQFLQEKKRESQAQSAPKSDAG